MGRRAIVVEELELPFPPIEQGCSSPRNTLATFECCPLCGGELAPEHAHYRCAACGWRDSCCD